MTGAAGEKAQQVPDPSAAALLSVSPLLQPHRTATIPSPYEVNAMLLQAMPPEARRRAAAGILRPRIFEPMDPRAFKADPRGFDLSVAVVHAGESRISASVARRSMVMTVNEPGQGSYTFGFRRRGALRVSGAGRAGDGSWGVGTGVLYREREGMRVATSDDHAGLSFELSYARILRLLQGLSERPVHGAFVFAPSFSFDSEPGRSVGRVVEYVERELGTAGSLFAGGRGAQVLEDLLIQSLLLALPHSHAHLLQAEPALAAPFHVQRAEEYMRAHAHEPLTAEQIAAAAGCGLRSLQAAFRKSRGRTPLETLRLMRLERTQQDLLRSDPGHSIIEIATKYQFSNLGRFADQYRVRFGYLPSQTPRA